MIVFIALAVLAGVTLAATVALRRKRSQREDDVCCIVAAVLENLQLPPECVKIDNIQRIN